MNTYQIYVDLNQEIRNLSVGAQQKVEILKALYRKSSLLILDEPTAVLTPQEIQELFVFIRQYVRQGNSVVLITHKLDEIMEISDRITVMRAGKIVGVYKRQEIKDKNELAAKMVGEKIDFNSQKHNR
ncbi:MAG: ATP-binding cassette domain-containing protein [Zhaonellaceae bacterium]